MTARQIQRETRNVAIWCARKGGCLIPILAQAHGISVRQVKSILKAMSDPKVQNASLEKILAALENKPSSASRPRKRFTPRAAPL